MGACAPRLLAFRYWLFLGLTSLREQSDDTEPLWKRPIANSLYGAEGDRTPDLCSAIAALSQLSYSPNVASVPAKVASVPAKVASVPAMKEGKSTDCQQHSQPKSVSLL